MLNQGHAPLATLVLQEAAGKSQEVSLILIHAEDQMMGAETFKAMVEQMIDVYKEIDALKAKLA